MPGPRRLPASALTVLACAALVVGSAPASAAATGPLTTARAAAHHRAGASCAKGSTRAERRACRSHLRSQQVKEAAAKQHVAKPRPPKKVRAKKLSAKSGETTEPSSTVAQPTPTPRTAATIATVLATPCQNTELTPEADNLPLVREAVLCLINRKRAEDSESPLVASPELEQAAESHCQELIADNYFAHISPSGETPVDRIRNTGYIPGPNVGYVIGENLAWGTYQLSTPQAIVAAWIASPGHLANILEAQYKETGIAITPSVPESVAPGATGATYAQEFGVIIP